MKDSKIIALVLGVVVLAASGYFTFTVSSKSYDPMIANSLGDASPQDSAQ